MQNEKLLSDIQSDDKDVRFAAWRAAGDADPSAIAPLSRLVALNERPGVAKAAREAITTMTHAAGADPSNPKRAAVVRQLLEVAGSESASLPARVLTIRLLSNIAGEDSVPAIVKWIAHADLREEVAYCLERIPGSASDKALAAAYRSAKEDFKPRILAALGHRRSAEGIAVCVDAMKSGNAELAGAGARAFGRIGKKQASVSWPANVDPDAVLRYADGLRDSANAGDAMRIYKTMLGRPEEHLQCAAIIGISRIGSPEAAAAIHPMLKSANRKVRITAANAWRTMA